VTRAPELRAFLRNRAVTLVELGVASWDEVVPVMPADSARAPKLFYFTGLFRLHAYAAHIKAVVATKRAYLPATGRTYIHYFPTWSGEGWNDMGIDPFLGQRDGGFEMSWTEDWLGYGASTQSAGDALAVLRAAGRDQPLGI